MEGGKRRWTAITATCNQDKCKCNKLWHRLLLSYGCTRAAWAAGRKNKSFSDSLFSFGSLPAFHYLSPQVCRSPLQRPTDAETFLNWCLKIISGSELLIYPQIIGYWEIRTFLWWWWEDPPPKRKHFHLKVLFFIIIYNYYYIIM